MAKAIARGRELRSAITVARLHARAAAVVVELLEAQQHHREPCGFAD
ncbi:protein of unknown function [Pararobbsia alpina]